VHGRFNRFFPASTPTKNSDASAFENVKISAVVTYVNDTDDQWKQDRQRCLRALTGQDAPSADATHRRRFCGNGEIVICLKSIKKFAPWIDGIYLVVSNRRQIEVHAPPELKEMVRMKQVVLVEHAEIIPEHLLPTFNSNVIDTYLHRIDGLNEFFIKFDDDIFLGRTVQKSDFLALAQDGRSIMKILLSRKPSDSMETYKKDSKRLYDRIMFTNAQLMAKLRNLPRLDHKIPQQRVTHGPQIQSIKLTVSLIKQLQSLNIPLSSAKFRHENDITIAPLVGQHYALMKGDAVYEFHDHDTFLMVAIADWNHRMAADLGAVLGNPPKFICVNNASTRANDESDGMLREFLEDFDRCAYFD